jgi:2',3'-cyclic-nucleotide 2'-phosphodiesterase/3'-nucleotidase
VNPDAQPDRQPDLPRRTHRRRTGIHRRHQQLPRGRRRHFPGANPTTVIFEGPDTNRDVIVRYIVDQGTISPTADANWTFAPMPGTTVLFDTGPAAADFIDGVEGVDIEPAGEGPDGFARYRISL